MQQVQERTGVQQRCPLCHERLVDGSEWIYACPGCDTDYHRTCARELGGCSTLGCTRLKVGPRADVGPAATVPPGRLQHLRTLVGEERWQQEMRLVNATRDQAMGPPRSSWEMLGNLLAGAAGILHLALGLAALRLGLEEHSTVFIAAGILFLAIPVIVEWLYRTLAKGDEA